MKSKQLLKLFFLLLVHTGCDIKGASDPFSYAPPVSNAVWVPPPKALKRSPAVDRALKLEDYHQLSKETPLTLAEIIDISLLTNPSTKESWATARVSAAEYGQSLQNDFILAGVDVNFERSRQAFVAGPSPAILYQTSYGPELQLSYIFLDFGQTRFTSEAALQSLYNADWSHNREIQSVIQLAMNDYYDFLYQKQLLYAKEQDVENAKVTLESTEEKFTQGVADISDIVQAKTSFLQQKLDLVTQKQALHNAYTALVNEMGLPANTPLYFEDYPEKLQTFELNTLDQLIQVAIGERPDLLAQEADLKSKEASLKAAKAKLFPVITTGFNIGRTYFQEGFNDRYDFQATVGLSYPLFQGFFIKNEIKQAMATLELSKAQLEQLKLSLIQEVSNFRSDVVYAKESMNYANAYLHSAEEDYKVNLKRYQVGTGTIVDLINAQTSVADARARVATAKNSWYTSIANLAYATGVLLPPEGKNPLPHIKPLLSR